MNTSFWLSTPVAAILFPVGYVSFLFLSGLVTPARPVYEDSYVYLFGGLFGMAIIAFIGTVAIRKPARSDKNRTKIAPDVRTESWLPALRLAYVLAVLGSFCLIADLWISLNGQLFTNMIDVRQTFLYRESTILAYPGNLLIPFCEVVLGVVILYFEQLRLFDRVLGLFLGFLPPIVLSLGLAGRQGIVLQLIFLVWWCLQRPAFGLPIVPKNIVTRIIAMTIVLVSVGLMISVSIDRSPEADQYRALLQFNQTTIRFSTPVLDTLDAIDPALANAAGEGLSFWSASVVYFDYFYHSWDVSPTYISVFSPTLYRRLADFYLVPSQTYVSVAWNALYRSAGLAPNAWATTWTQMIQSFGRMGALMVAGVVAFLSSTNFVKSRYSGSFRGLYISAMLFCFFFLWFQFSAFMFPVVEYGFVIVLLAGPMLARFDMKRQPADNP